MEHHGFPADETLAEYIDGRLDAEGRQRVVEHLAACPECYDTFLTATEFAAIHPESATRGGEVVQGRFGRSAWYAAAAAVAVLAVGLIPFRASIGRRYDAWAFGSRTGVSKLVAAADEVRFRPVEPRFSGGFEYKEARPRFRGSDPIENEMLIVESAAVALEVAAQQSKAKEYGAAVGEVFRGEVEPGTARFERILLESTAKKDLRQAIAASTDKRLLTDIAAAWIVRSERHGDQGKGDLELAVLAADRALQLDPRYAEAAYNRALAVDHLDDPAKAIAAWERYKQIETDPRWQKEAQDHIDRAREDLSFAAAPKTP